MKIAITGLSGTLGQRLLLNAYFKKNNVIDLFHTKQLDQEGVVSVECNLLNNDEISEAMTQVAPDVVIHLAAITHIDVCETDKTNGKSGLVWRTNVDATETLAKRCQQLGSKLIYLSTECIFDGQRGMYNEEASPNPKNWYGYTKATAEEAIVKSGCEFSIIRGVIAYHPNSPNTIYSSIKNQLENAGSCQVVADQNITPTYIDDIVKAITVTLQNQLAGVVHVVPKEITTPYEFAKKIATYFEHDQSSLKPVTMKEFFGPERAALRLRNATLDGSKSNTLLGFVPSTLDDVLAI